MKKNSKIYAGYKIKFIFLLYFIQSVAKSNAQESIFDYLSQAVSKIVAGATIGNLANYDYIDGNSMFGVFLSQGNSQSLVMQFEKDINYMVIGAGDNDIIDLDLALISSNGLILDQDDDDDATPLLSFKSNYSNKMTIRITNYESYRDGFCVIVLLRESNSGNFSLYQITQALANVIQNSQIPYLFSSRFAIGTFCLFGGKLENGANTYLYNCQPPPGNYALIGAGSDNISDADLFVIRQSSMNSVHGTEIVKDTATDDRPICTFHIHQGFYYLFKHKNYSSYNNSSGFIFSILLEL